MKKTPTVSIVIPAYNHADFLRECIESVLDQNYTQIELIVLDDGSTDSTASILASYGGRFQWESHSNMGQSATLNKGWAMAKGDILGYLSADDVLRPDAVSKSVFELMSQTEIVATYCDFDLIDQKSRRVRTVTTPNFDIKDLVFDLVCQPGPGAFFRRASYLEAGPWDTNLRQNPDLDFWLRLSLRGRFLRIPVVLAGFRVHDGSATYKSANQPRADEAILIASRFISTSCLPDWIRKSSKRIITTGYIASAQLHLRAGRLLMGMQRLTCALRISPRTLLSKRSVHLLVSAVIGRVLHRIRVSLAGIIS